MVPTVLLPLLGVTAMAVMVTTVHRRLPAVIASRVVAITLIVTTSAALPTLWILGFGYLAHAPYNGAAFGWCVEVFRSHGRIAPLIGIPSLALAVIGAVRAARVLRTHHRLRNDHPGSVEVTRNDQPFAFTLPGRGGRVVVSTGLIELLDDDECAVVIAHEHAHARYRHDRYLLVAKLASTTIPMLRPLASRLQFSLERWADEAAVKACGDRHFVARTLGKVALHGAVPVGALGFTGLGVPARVVALFGPPAVAPRSSLLISLWLTIAGTGALAAFQIHHLVSFVAALCPG